MGSLTGAVASQSVTEAPQGRLSLDGHETVSAKTYAGLTARPTSRAGAKAEVSDPTAMFGISYDLPNS